MNGILKNLIIILMFFLLWSATLLQAADFSTAVESVAEKLASKLHRKKVTIGLILEQKTKARYQLSDVLTDEISIALQNQGIEILISEKDTAKLKREWVRMMDSSFREEAAEKIGKLLGADVIGIGTFRQWGNDYRVAIQMIDATTGQVLVGTSVTIDGRSVPKDLMKPVIVREFGVQVLKGVGQASISHQCPKEPQRTKTCPPRTELRRRALEVAKMFAIQQIVEQSGVNAFSVQRVLSGRLQPGEVKTQAGKQLVRLEFGDPTEQGDQVSVELVAEIK